MGILVVIALETNTITEIVLAMESDIIAINANANTANLGSITTIVLCSVIIIAIIIIAIEISLSIETTQMTISCWGCWGIRSAQWQGELDGTDVTGRDVSLDLCCPLAHKRPLRITSRKIPRVYPVEVVCDTVGSEFAGIWVFPRKGLVFLRMRHFHVKCGIFVDGLVACVA